jgi:hypothetical protein
LNLTITGPNAHKAFTTKCTPSSTTATFTSQSDVTKTVSSKVTLTHCAASPSASGAASGLAAGHPKLHISVSHGQAAANIASLAVALPGLKFAPSAIMASRTCLAKQAKKKCTTTGVIKGLEISGASLKSIALESGKLVVTLQKAAGSITVNVSGPVLIETSSLQRRVTKHKVNTVTVRVTVTDAKHTTTSVPLKLKAR